MATIIYDDEFGARSTKIFGCSFKSITAQMGFNSQPIVMTLTVNEEEDQDFTLDQYDVRSVQHISFGEIDFMGIVQSWERTSVDINGTGTYTVRLTDCRTVLDAANIANVYVDQPESEVALIDSNVVYVGSNESTEEGSNREEDEGVPFSTIIERIEASTLRYGNNTFEVDMRELGTLENWRGDGVDQYYIQGALRSLVSTITEFCNAVGAEWWVESKRKSVVDDTIVIVIKTIRRLDGIGNPNSIDLDTLAEIHGDRVIRRQDGYENTDIVTNKVIWGGVKRKLRQAHGIDLKPFWGFDDNGSPLSSPSFIMPDEPQSRRFETDVDEMEQVLNGELDGQIDADRLAAIYRYVDDFWGKRFYWKMNKNTLSDSGKDLPNYPEVVQAGWWEGETPPQGARQFTPDILRKMTTEDGRWGPFVRLSELFLTGSGTLESPTVPHYVTWSPSTENSNNFIQREGESYMKCLIQQYGRYVIITLPVPLTRYYMDPATGALNENRVTRHTSLTNAWIPLMDRSLHYGPWSNTSLVKSRVPSPGASEVAVDKDLVPWVFGIRGLLNETAQDLLTEMAAKKIDALPGLSVINTGQLEVADVPKTNIGQAIGLGGSITEIFVRFDNNGVSTRYTANIYTRELGEFKRKKQKEAEKQQEDAEKSGGPDEDEFPETNDDTAEPPEPEVGDDPSGPEDVSLEALYQKPEGGLGIVTFKEGGPFYAVRRLNYADIDSQTFAGGLNITNSYFLSEWTNVRNLAEPENSPGWLPVGTRVTVSIFSLGDETGPYVPYIEQTPPTFAPPLT